MCNINLSIYIQKYLRQILKKKAWGGGLDLTNRRKEKYCFIFFIFNKSGYLIFDSLVKFLLCVDLQGLIPLLLFSNPSEVLLGTFLQNLFVLSRNKKTKCLSCLSKCL